MAAPRLSEIWGDSVRRDLCRDRRCGRRIYFATNVRTGNEMPFDVRPVALTVQPEIETGRERWTVDLAANHFASCVGAQRFRRAR